MTPAQRVDEYANEQAFHKDDISDNHAVVIEKYLRMDGLKAIPRIIEVMNEYDPQTAIGTGEHKGERFDAMWMLIDDLDNKVVRLRASEEGRQAIDALARAIDRMRAAGYGRKDQHEWEQHGRFDLAEMAFQDAKGINATDEAIKDTFWVRYKLKVSDKQLLAFSNFLIVRDPTYPVGAKWMTSRITRESTRQVTRLKFLS